MKIVYCLPDTYKPGGIERIVSLKANYLADVAGYDVVLITSGQGNKEPFYQFSNKIQFYDLDINYDEMLAMSLHKRLKARQKKKKLHKQRLKSLLFDLKADVVVSTFTHEAEFLPMIKDGSKKLLEFHFCRGHKRMMADAFNFSFATKLAYYLRAWIEENVIIPRYDQFVVLTEEDKNRWQKKIKNVIAIPNILPFDNNKKAALSNKKVIAVGRLDAQKGFDRLIDIWKNVSGECPDWQLNIYGKGRHQKQLEQQIKANGISATCHINAPVKNIQDKYLDSSIFVMTSRYEGMPMTLLEAVGLGLPCVTYDFKCGPRDIITHGKNGFLIKENNTQTMIRELTELMKNDDLRIKMGNASKNGSKLFSLENVMQRWIYCFNQLTSK